MSAVLDRVPVLSAFRGVASPDLLAVALAIMEGQGAGEAEIAPRIVSAGELHAEYLTHLVVSGERGTHHAGLAQTVEALASLNGESEVRVRNIRGPAGRVILLTHGADQPLGLVALRPYTI